MKLRIVNEIFEYKNEPASIEEMFQLINEKLDHSELYFSHLVVDGEEIYENHDAYLFDKIESIEQIEASVKTVHQFVNDLMLDSEDYLNRVIPVVSILVDEFYQGPTQGTWGKLLQLIEGIQWLNEFVQNIDKGHYKPSNWNEYLTVTYTIHEELKNLEEAMENQDAVLIADLTSYEIVPLLEQFKQLLTESIDEIGVRPETN